MKQTKQPPVAVTTKGPEQWIERLTATLRTVDAMDSDERAAAFRFMKSKYSKEWPSSDY